MFDCGITTRTQELSNQIIHDQENCIVRAVQELYVDIDKEKLEKCLHDSKSYYDEGLREGYKIYLIPEQEIIVLCGNEGYITTEVIFEGIENILKKNGVEIDD